MSIYCLTVKRKLDNLEGVPSKGVGFSILMVCYTNTDVWVGATVACAVLCC